MRKYAAMAMVLGMLMTNALAMVSQHAVERERLNTDILSRTVPGDEVEYLTATDAFLRALGSTGTPGGVIKIADCKAEPVTSAWRPHGATLREVLNSIVATDARYQWQIDNGVVNILPVTGEPPLLKTPMPDFHYEGTSEHRLLGELLDSPKIKEAMTSLGLKRGLEFFSILSSLRPLQFEVHWKDATFREALNAIARAQGRAIWVYIEIPCNGNQVIIRF